VVAGAVVIRLDTHVVVWLYTGEAERLSELARTALESEPAVVSPVVQLELTHLHEIGRLNVTGADIVGDLRGRIGLALSEQPLITLVHAAAGLTWTRDPFDRLIVADALAAGTPLLTKDEAILQHCDLAWWDAPPPPPPLVPPRRRRR
jgi:PIN domain nuclease of toxin-antitoxin system